MRTIKIKNVPFEGNAGQYIGYVHNALSGKRYKIEVWRTDNKLWSFCIVNQRTMQECDRDEGWELLRDAAYKAIDAVRSQNRGY